MKLRTLLAGALAFSMVGGMIATPNVALAQSSAYRHRQKTKNDWRNAAYISGGLGLLGLLNHDSTLTFLGTAGALYSANRYEQDRKSQSRMRRARASIFSRGYYYRGGHEYRRYSTYRHGQKYYYFRRVR